MPLILSDLLQTKKEAINKTIKARKCAEEVIGTIRDNFIFLQPTQYSYCTIHELRLKHDSRECRLESIPYIGYCAQKITITIEDDFQIDFVLRVYASAQDYFVYFDQKKIGDQNTSADGISEAITTSIKQIIEDKIYQMA